MHGAAQQRHYSTVSDSHQWQSRAVIIQEGISCYRLFLPYIRKTTADLFVVGHQHKNSFLPPPLRMASRCTLHGSYRRPAKQEGAVVMHAAMSSTGIPQLVLREGKRCACVSKEHGLPGVALQQCCVFQGCQQG